jgi:hypothetical protein
MFSDEVRAFGGAHTQEYVIVKKDGSDRYQPEICRHKYSKLYAWMFYAVIVDGKKGPALFWEKDWGTMNSVKYDREILTRIQAFRAIPGHERYIWMQDNAPSHRSELTKLNMRARGIVYIPWPVCSADLNLIEHVWNWMKNWI